MRAGAHATFGTVVCIEFCVGFDDDSDAVTSRQKSGPPPMRAHRRCHAVGHPGPAAAARRSSGAAPSSRYRSSASTTRPASFAVAAAGRRRRRGKEENGYLFTSPAGQLSTRRPALFVARR